MPYDPTKTIAVNDAYFNERERDHERRLGLLESAAPVTYSLKAVMIGDSIGGGSQAAYPGFDRVAVPGVGLVNTSVGGSTLVEALTEARNGSVANQIDAAKPTLFIVERGVNDFGAQNRSADVVYYDAAVPLAALIRSTGAYCVFETVLKSDPAVALQAAQEAQRVIYNDRLVYGGDALLDGYINSAADPLFQDPTDRTIFADGLHLSTTGQDRKTTYYTAAIKQIATLSKRPPTVVIYGRPPAAVVGTAYTWTVPRVGGTAPFTFSASGLPAGLSIAASTGIVSGTPTTAGNVTGSISVTDAAGKTWGLANRTFLVAGAAGNAAIASANLGGATYETGKFGQGRTGGQGTIPASVLPVSPARPITIEAWIKAPTDGFVVPFGMADVFYAGTGGGALILTVVGAGNIDQNAPNISDAPHFVRVVLTATKTELFLDGASLGSVGPATFGNALLEVGGYKNSFGFGGIIDDFAIYGTDRSTAPVPTAPVAGGAAGLLGVYPFNGTLAGFK